MPPPAHILLSKYSHLLIVSLMAGPSIPQSPALERGKACLRCRFVPTHRAFWRTLTRPTGGAKWYVHVGVSTASTDHEQRCDGAKPACSQCIRSHAEDCEYTDGGPTASQILERSVAELEARIRELEGGDAAVLLHDPHAPPPTPPTLAGQVPPAIMPTSQRM